MDSKYFTQLTNDLYQITLLFPEGEPLKYKMRDLGSTVLNNLILLIEGKEEKECLDLTREIRRVIDPLNSFFEVVKSQKWVELSLLEEIQEKYLIIKEEMEKFEDYVKQNKVVLQKSFTPSKESVSFNERQKKIVTLLREKEKVQVNDIQLVFPKITKRTIRRDFDLLLEKGVVERLGKANMTFYQLADNES